MTKFNKQVKVEQEVEQHKDATVNKEGGLAFKLEPLTRLYTRVSSCLVNEPKFYKNIVENEEQIIIDQNGKKIQTIKTIKVEDNEEIIRLIGVKKGFIKKHGEIEENRVAIQIIRDWQRGNLRL